MELNTALAEMRIGDNFKIVKKIGSGAFGEIYKGNFKEPPRLL